jgi:hypothetical protein
LGSEIVTLKDASGAGKIKKLYAFSPTKDESIDIFNEGFTFFTDSAYAQITHYKLMHKNAAGLYDNYISSQVTLNGLIITVKTDQALVKTLYVEAST